MIPHAEYEIRVLAPNDLGLCVWEGCTENGEHALVVKNDGDKTTKHKDPLCPKHLLSEIVLTVLDGPNK